VRIEGVRGSNPLSSTEKLQVRGSPTALILPAGWELSPYWEESGRSCPPGPGGDSPARLAWLALSAVSDVVVTFTIPTRFWVCGPRDLRSRGITHCRWRLSQSRLVTD